MKKLLVTALLAVAGFANAETTNVTVYGIVDVGVLNASHVGAANGNATQMLSSPMDTSRLGFTGTEDLGNGLKAGFNLESQINPNDGTQGTSASSGATNGTFARAANVFVDSGVGKFTIGRQPNAAFQAFNVADVRGGKNYGSSLTFWNDGSTFGGTSIAKTGINSYTGSTFFSNAFRYDTPTFSGLRGSVQFVTGGVAGSGSLGDTSASNKKVVTAIYENGPAQLTAGVVQSTSSASETNGKAVTYGGNYTLGKLKLASGWTKFENPAGAGAANTEFSLKQVSARYEVSSKLAVSTGFYSLADKINGANGSKLTSLVADYELSKRTGLYAGVANVHNRGTSGFNAYGASGANSNSLAGAGTYPSVVSAAGGVQKSYLVGITHRF